MHYTFLLLLISQVFFKFSSAECGGNFTEEFNGTFTSPGYPNNYKFGLDCTWTIKVATGNKVSLTIANVDIKSTGGGDIGCGENKVSVSDPNSKAPVKTFCTQSQPQGVIISEGNELVVKFISTKNETDSSKGFTATFTTILPPTTTSTTTTTTTTVNTTTATPTNTTTTTTSGTTNAPVTKAPESRLSSGGIAAICIVVILCVLLLVDLILYQRNMGVIYTIKKSCCGGYDSVSSK